MVDSKTYSKPDADKFMSLVTADQFPAELRDLYLGMLKTGIKARLDKDVNYPSLKG